MTKTFLRRATTVAAALILVVSGRVGWTASLRPSLKDVPYGSNEAQRLDLYLAESERPTPVMLYIHGGGWRAGSKKRIPGFLGRAVSEGWLSVVSVEYRFTDEAIHPAQVEDCMRAVQFVRSKAGEWNLDPRRIGVTGGSAGAHLSLWVALHDDGAVSDSEDPVRRQSTRVSCVVGFAGPTDWSLLGEIPHKHPAYRQLLGYEPGTPAEEMSTDLKTDVSPITFVSKDDPPVLLVHGDKDAVVPIRHSQELQAELDAVEVDCEVFVVEGGRHGVARARGKAASEVAVEFIKEHLLQPNEQ